MFSKPTRAPDGKASKHYRRYRVRHLMTQHTTQVQRFRIIKLLGSKCYKCSETNPANLVVHHLYYDKDDNSAKVPNYAQILSDLTENPQTKKYELLCTEHHRAHHHAMRVIKLRGIPLE